MKSIRTLMTLCLFLAATQVFAQHQSWPMLRAKVPFAFTVGNEMFPAGEYRISSIQLDHSIRIAGEGAESTFQYSDGVAELCDSSVPEDAPRVCAVRRQLFPEGNLEGRFGRDPSVSRKHAGKGIGEGGFHPAACGSGARFIRSIAPPSTILGWTQIRMRSPRFSVCGLTGKEADVGSGLGSDALAEFIQHGEDHWRCHPGGSG